MRGMAFNRIKGILGVLMIISAVGIIIYWENIGREELLYKEIIIAKEDIHKNDMITEENITFAKIEKNMITDHTALEREQVLNKESKQFIPQKSIIDLRYLGEPELLIHDDEYIMKIPGGWIHECPDSLRRGDHIFLYPILLSTEQFPGDESALKEEVVFKKAPVAEMIVAYVKDSGNREVVNAGNEKSERLDGTAGIDSIEVIISLDIIEELLDLYEKGYKFIALYQ